MDPNFFLKCIVLQLSKKIRRTQNYGHKKPDYIERYISMAKQTCGGL